MPGAAAACPGQRICSISPLLASTVITRTLPSSPSHLTL
jgi:hypothetical protein